MTDCPNVAARLLLHGTHQGRLAGRPPSGRSIDIAGVEVLVEHRGPFV